MLIEWWTRLAGGRGFSLKNIHTEVICREHYAILVLEGEDTRSSNDWLSLEEPSLSSELSSTVRFGVLTVSAGRPPRTRLTWELWHGGGRYRKRRKHRFAIGSKEVS